MCVRVVHSTSFQVGKGNQRTPTRLGGPTLTQVWERVRTYSVWGSPDLGQGFPAISASLFIPIHSATPRVVFVLPGSLGNSGCRHPEEASFVYQGHGNWGNPPQLASWPPNAPRDSPSSCQAPCSWKGFDFGIDLPQLMGVLWLVATLFVCKPQHIECSSPHTCFHL